MRIAHNKLTQTEYLKRVKKRYKNYYDYSLCVYNGYNSEISIICPIHGLFTQQAADHLHSGGCKKCGSQRGALKTKANPKEFISKANKIHNNNYDYSKVEYINNRIKVCIICPKHGEFWQAPDPHITKKCGCPKCMRESQFYTQEEFLQKAKEVHSDLYDYSKVRYQRADIKVEIICKKHGVFLQSPECHLMGKGCQSCIRKEEYKLGLLIEQYFPDWEITRQKKLFSVPHERYRYFDFYLERGKETIIIEYDGKQHEKPVRFNYAMTAQQARKKFEKQQETDKLDKQFCVRHKIDLFRVKHSDRKENQIKDISEKYKNSEFCRL